MRVIYLCLPEQKEVTLINQKESKPNKAGWLVYSVLIWGDNLTVSRNEVMAENGLFVLCIQTSEMPQTPYSF